MADVTRLVDGNLTSVPGFRAAGVACGLKPDSALDLSLVVADAPCTAAAVFTANRVQAAPVLYDRELIRARNTVQAVVINSGFANACTGARGLSDVRQTAAWVEDALRISAQSVFVMSTGVIGQHLPIDKIRRGIDDARRALSPRGGPDAARAIMTTDTRPKSAAAQIQVDGRTVTIGGMCKGAGMIHPNMATMLALIVTDVTIEHPVLQVALQTAVDRSFNMITVDGDTSTNDTVLLLANGAAGNPAIMDTTSAEYDMFTECLSVVATDLAQSVVRDGEGATKFITIRVTAAPDVAAAKQVAKSIATSTLVKTAVYGQDANWGRVVCAAGYSGVEIDPERLSLWMENDADSLFLVKDGAPFEVDETRAAAVLAGDEVTFWLDLGLGTGEATAWTCDLSHKYVDINAHYRT